MGLDVQGLVGVAFGIAKALVPDAFPSSTVRLGPTSVVDPVTEIAVVTWAVELTGLDSLLGYDDSNERTDKTAPDQNLRTFALQNSLVPDGTLAHQSGEIVTEGKTWQVYRVETDPSRSLVLFYCNR